MNQEALSDAIGCIDDSLIEKYIEMQNEYSVKRAQRVATLQKRWRAIAACLAIALIGMTAAQFIPVTYDLEYEIETEGEIQKKYYAGGVQKIYYVNRLGMVVLKPVYFKPGDSPTVQKKVIVWKHLNHLDIEIHSEFSREERFHEVKISKELQQYKNYEKLMESLRKTLEIDENDDFIKIVFE
ncbi:MAG: hypothetical protein IJX39_00645 [Clostridia bacterium]|nr:hypothetical protein [Clostridia bacterium]